MKNIKRILILISFCMVLALFMGVVSAASLNLTETELASEGVKNYTEAHGNIPGYVMVSDKNSSAPSFLKTLTKTTVQLNSGSTAPVNISSVSSPTGPSGSATGNLYKADYVTVANNVYNYINTNGRAPNYASSSLGNIRYESLVYTYSKVVNFYQDNGYLPNYVSVVYYTGVDSTGVVIDNVPPSVSNSLAPGSYSTAQSVTLTATDSHDPNPKVYYSTNNGTTWNNQANSVTLSLGQGVTALKYYGRDAAGNQGATQTATYTINTNMPNFSLEDLEYASSSVQTYVEANHQLPANVTINGTTVNMAQFLKLIATAAININGSLNSSISLGNYTAATNPSETITTSGNLNKTDYLNLANSIKSYMDSNGRAPDYRTISLGNMRYESLVYTFAQILKSYQVAEILPNYITVIPWTTVANNSTAFITMDQIRNAADTVQSYIETKHQLPDHVTILGSKVSMPNFLKLEITYLVNANDNLYQSIILRNYNTAPNPYESITGGNLNSTDYLDAANRIINFMDVNGYTPNYVTTVRGYIRYESLVYTYAEIINSASNKLRLPGYITLTPWTTVTNSNTVFITMDQINTVVWAVKNYVETNHALPSSVTISGRQITMPQFLKLELTSLKNIYAGLYQSIVLQSYSAPASPSETLASGKINYENYLTVADNVISFMNSNGQAPNYAWTSQGNMRYEGLVHMYSQIINYYNVNDKLPQYVTVNPWTTVASPGTVTFNAGQIISGAETVKTYIETHHALPSSVTISGTAVSMPQFLKLLTTTLHNINSTYAGQLVLGSYGPPIDTPETVTGGTLNQTQYLDLARQVEFFMYGDERAPNYQSSSLGNICYQSLIYMYSQVLSSYKANNYTLPDMITVRPWSVVSNANTAFITTDQIKNAAGTVKSYVETNHALPSSVTISGISVSMPKFLKLLATAVTNINGKLNATIVLQSYNTPSSPSETVTGGSLNNTDYLSLANNIISYMDSNGQAPNYTSSNLGNIRYESLVYLYSLIMDYYGNRTELPQNVTVTPWSVVSNANTVFFTNNQVENAAKTVQSYIETNHQLPANVTINGTVVTMSQFLQLATTASLNLDGSLYTSIVLKSYNAATSPSETVTTNGTIADTDYINLANDIISYMYTNGKAPDYRTINMGNLRFESLVYMYSQILSSYNATSTLPEFITVTPWSIVSNPSTMFITTDQIKNASQTVKSYVDTNHALPSSVTISGTAVTMPQFLKLTANAIINIESYLNTSIILDSAGAPTGPAENITSGTIVNSEFVDMAKYIKSYMDSHGTAPNNVTNTSIGDTMRYESLIYMFSKIMTSYNANETAPEEVSVIPWLALSNPNGTFNFRTQEIFNSIQEAIDDVDTISGDTIWLEKSTYLENVVINKKVTIRPISDLNVTIQALNSSLPIFTINIGGNGTTIQDLILNGSTGNAGIYINNSNENQILGNNITNSNNGIYIYNSKENVISGNNILNNSVNGVLISTGSENEISSNKITSNAFAGINIQNSDKNRICSNILSNNMDGIYLNNSSTEVHFNQIVGNSRYGLYNLGNGTVNATNNWWGSNNPIVSSTNPSDINIAGGNVTYNPWLILSINSSTDRSDRNGTYYNYQITADLTHNNQGNDTSSDGNIPDDIPVYFNSTIGTINTSGSTKKGKAELKLTSTTSGTANVSATLDNQTVSQSVNITSVNVLGVYNTRTQESFASIQEAIDDADTRDGDTLTIAEGTYTENVAVNKRIKIESATGANVIVKPLKSDKSVILVVNSGSGTTIQGLNIIGAGISYGISLSHAYDCTIKNNVISNSSRNIYLYLSGNNNITENTIKNGINGISLYKSGGNSISYNLITKNENGIYAVLSNYNVITENNISNNYYGNYMFHSNNINISGNNVTVNWVGIYFYDTNNNCVTGNNLNDNGAGITYYNSIGTIISGNSFTDNWLTDTSVVDSGDVIMATTIYTCGPAALATILKSIGIYTTEAEMAKIAGTDETGTSLLGLKHAANAKGINAYGYELTVEQLQTNYIVVLKINGYNHFDVIQNITNDTVTLFDPNLGIIQMNLTTFNELYTGYAFVLNEEIPGAVQLTDNEMSGIKGLWHTVRTIKWRWHPAEWRYYTIVIDRYIPYPVIRWSYFPGWTIWTPWGNRVVGNFWYPSGITIHYYHLYIKHKIWYYVPGYFESYVAYVREAEQKDINYKNFIGATATLASAGYFGVETVGTSLISGVGSILTHGTAASGIFTAMGVYSTDFTNIVNPDPNPTGAGEGYVNCIDPSMEWMIMSK
jgi:parallel beta-helix repeat protein